MSEPKLKYKVEIPVALTLQLQPVLAKKEIPMPEDRSLEKEKEQTLSAERIFGIIERIKEL